MKAEIKERTRSCRVLGLRPVALQERWQPLPSNGNRF